MPVEKLGPVFEAPPGTRLPRAFYDRPVLDVARDCIGAILVHRTPEGVTSGRIVESEAYRGPDDLAAHSAGGRRTKRTEAMFGPPGRAYVYFIYGMHWAFNIVVAKEGDPHAVLVRAIEPIEGLALMAARRGIDASRREISNGPGKVCQALGIRGDEYGADLVEGDASAPRELYLVKGPGPRPNIGRSPRINIDYAGAWVDKPWRFYERDNRYVSVSPRT